MWNKRLIGVLVFVTCGLLLAFSMDRPWRDAEVTAVGGSVVSETGHRLNTVTVVLYDDSGVPWKKFVISEDAFDGKTKTDMSKGAKFRAYCDVIHTRDLQATSLMVEYRDKKNHKKTELHVVDQDKSDSCF
jgi:hypothetical protein